MPYYYVEPEVAGGLGKNTILDSKTHPTRIYKLHYEFAGWLGDALVESFPCFIIKADAAEALQAAKLTGANYRGVEITLSPEFQETYPHNVLPEFVWLDVVGKAGVDDFGIADDLRLMVSKRALDIIELYGLRRASVVIAQ